MSERVSVTEVRNALRCPRIFALGRMEQKVVSFPVGSSCLGATFHRLLDRFSNSVGAAPGALEALPEGAPRDEIELILRAWLLSYLTEELAADPGYWTIPAEVDDLAEALREFARHLAGRVATLQMKPALGLRKVLHSGERQLEATWPGGPLIHGRLDAIFRDRNGDFEVVEYKLTDEANDLLDQAQAVLYQKLFRISEGTEAEASILRFTPTLRETNLSSPAADSFAAELIEPTVRQMVGWAREPLTAPATDRRDLCATCPMAAPCAAHYPLRTPQRDDPPVAAKRPRNAGGGEPLRESAAPTAHDPLRDEEGIREAQQIRDTIIDALRQLGAAAVSPRRPIVGPRTYLVEVSRQHGSVTALDRAAKDVEHRLASEMGIEVSYEKQGGHRRFCVTRKKPRAIFLSPLLEEKVAWLSEQPGRFLLGQEPDGKVLVGDFSDGSAAHLLVAGQTGSGKSVFLQSLLASLVRFHGPESVRFHLVDPKRVTFTSASFRSSLAAHLEGPISFDAEETLPLISQLVELMEERYRLFADEQVTDILEYNEAKPEARLERRILVVDEFQDLLADKNVAKEFCAGVARLGAKARAAGIHLVLATQRPSADVLPPIIKANLCGRVAFQVASATNSRIILDQKGAENLLGKGDMLANLGRGVVRAQAPLLTDSSPNGMEALSPNRPAPG